MNVDLHVCDCSSQKCNIYQYTMYTTDDQVLMFKCQMITGV